MINCQMSYKQYLLKNKSSLYFLRLELYSTFSDSCFTLMWPCEPAPPTPNKSFATYLPLSVTLLEGNTKGEDIQESKILKVNGVTRGAWARFYFCSQN